MQSSSGIAWEEGQSAGLFAPGRLPCQALDHATGYIAAFAVMAALERRATEGGSWLIRVSLAQTARWLRSFGKNPAGVAGAPLSDLELQPWYEYIDSPYGKVRAIAPVEQMPACPPRLFLPPSFPDTHAPEWL